MDKMQELYEKVAKDSGLRVKFEMIMKDAGDAKFPEKLTAFAKEAGYDVSIEEAQKFFKALSEEKMGQLSESELDMVAGGKGFLFFVNSIGTLGAGCAAATIAGGCDV